MSKLILRSIRQAAYQFIIWPIVAVLALSASLLVVAENAGFSALLGGIVWVIPNGFVAYKLFSNVSARAAGQIVATFYFAEALKLFLTAILFVVILKMWPLKLGYFLLGYGIAQIAFWLTPWFSKVKQV